MKQLYLVFFLSLFFMSIGKSQSFQEYTDLGTIITENNCRVILPKICVNPEKELIWTGTCSDGKGYGFGTLYYEENGKQILVYKGNLKDGYLHGMGTVYEEDTIFGNKGILYKGGFRQGLFDGFGTFYILEYHKHEGLWKNGLREGKGRYWGYSFTEDSYQEGIWANDLMDTILIEYNSLYMSKIEYFEWKGQRLAKEFVYWTRNSNSNFEEFRIRERYTDGRGKNLIRMVIQYRSGKPVRVSFYKDNVSSMWDFSRRVLLSINVSWKGADCSYDVIWYKNKKYLEKYADFLCIINQQGECVQNIDLEVIDSREVKKKKHLFFYEIPYDNVREPTYEF